VSTQEVIDGTVEEHDEEQPASQEVIHQPRLAVTPQVKATELVERLDVIRDAMQTAMTRDVDYGVIPGTGTKPTLLKPGAEKLGVLFQLDVQLVNEKHWGPGDHLTVTSQATVFHFPTGARLGYGEGICSTREKKYAVRNEQRKCPDCGKATVIKGKAEYGGGWLCFKKKGGCGAKWPDGAEVIESQTTGEVENPDLPDSWNTVVKMAEKRARIDAVLAVTGASALFTQDLDDEVERAPESAPAPSSQPDRVPSDTGVDVALLDLENEELAQRLLTPEAALKHLSAADTLDLKRALNERLKKAQAEREKAA